MTRKKKKTECTILLKLRMCTHKWKVGSNSTKETRSMTLDLLKKMLVEIHLGSLSSNPLKRSITFQTCEFFCHSEKKVVIRFPVGRMAMLICALSRKTFKNEQKKNENS